MSMFDEIAIRTLNELRIEMTDGLEIMNGCPLMMKLRSLNILTKHECETISNNPTNSARMNKLIDCISMRLTQEYFIKFFELIGDEKFGNNKPLKEQIIETYRGKGGNLSNDNGDRVMQSVEERNTNS